MTSRCYLGVLALALLTSTSYADARFLSHPPMRPLPAAAKRPLAKGPGFYVDPKGGVDAADGSKAKPWKTLAHAVKRLEPGDTLYLHGGIYFENVVLSRRGTAAAPITIRSAPGELAIIDGGLREFFEAPRTAWEPVKGGARGEYRSTSTYPKMAKLSEQGRGVWVTGNFADSMVPLHGYKFESDFRTANQYWTVSKDEAGTGIYLGPGLWFDWKTHRIHVRLGHTSLKSQPNYRGETDPRKLPLVIGVDRSALRIQKSKHVRLQDLVVRGSARHTVHITGSEHVELDSVTIYGGSPSLFVRSTNQLRLVRSNLRGGAAPWSSRQSMKYRGNSPYLFIADSTLPQSRDWELAFNEFTDSHDGVVIDSIRKLRFHHNRVDNFNDDALYLTLVPRAAVPHDIRIYENVITRSYTALAFGDRGARQPNPVGTGVFVFRNLFDLREGNYTSIPKDAATEAAYKASPGRMCGDHGSPIWEPLFFYQNTVFTAAMAWRDYYGAQMIIGARGTKRRVFNNVFVQAQGNPGLYFKGLTEHDLHVDGNLLWSLDRGPGFKGDFFAAFRKSPIFAASKQVYEPGFAAHDLYADPRFVAPQAANVDVRLKPKSPAIDRGIAIPPAWPDSLHQLDQGKPDIGALPNGVPMLRVGPRNAPSGTK